MTDSRAADRKSAREGRLMLGEALAALDEDTRARLEIESAIRSLSELDRQSSDSQDYRHLRRATEHLSRALAGLSVTAPSAEADQATEAVARTLALLYPLSQFLHRRRRRGKTNEPPLPEQRAAERVSVEVQIGLLTESHFYTGLSQDLSQGGIFVATYQSRPPGTAMTLYFVLPSGRAVTAKGVVRWQSEAAGDMPPGMGVAFEEIADEDLCAIAEFCEDRSPLYHFSADD